MKELEGELGPCLAVFMLATYGEGDPTDNAMEFHEKLTSDSLEVNGLKYAVFGLGKLLENKKLCTVGYLGTRFKDGDRSEKRGLFRSKTL